MTDKKQRVINYGRWYGFRYPTSGPPRDAKSRRPQSNGPFNNVKNRGFFARTEQLAAHLARMDPPEIGVFAAAACVD
jgi:hypothetical protein